MQRARRLCRKVVLFVKLPWRRRRRVQPIGSPLPQVMSSAARVVLCLLLLGFLTPALLVCVCVRACVRACDNPLCFCLFQTPSYLLTYCLSVCLSLSLCLCLPVSLSLSLSLSLSPPSTPPPPLCPCLSVCLSVCLSLSPPPPPSLQLGF